MLLLTCTGRRRKREQGRVADQEPTAFSLRESRLERISSGQVRDGCCAGGRTRAAPGWPCPQEPQYENVTDPLSSGAP